MTTASGKIVRTRTDEIRSIGRASQGVKVIDLRDKDSVAGVSLIQTLREEEEEESSEETPADE